MAPWVNRVCFIWDGAVIGATVPMRNAMFIAALLVFFRYITLWLAMTRYMVVRGITLVLLPPRHILAPVAG